MKLSKVFVIFLCAFGTSVVVSCSEDAQQTSQNPLENVFTLELSFGDKNLPDEYLLAKPTGIAVGTDGSIIVVDENKLKVFTGAGKPVKIVGRLGQGPGDFESALMPAISETGYLTVKNGATKYNFYSPDIAFIKSAAIITPTVRNTIWEKYKLAILLFNSIYAYSPDEMIFHASALKIDDNTPYAAIFYQKDGALTLIASTENKSIFAGARWLPLSEIGEMHMALLPGKKIAYANTTTHKTLENKIWYYQICIFDITTGTQTEIKYRYVPVKLPDSVIDAKGTKYRGPVTEEIIKTQSDRYKEIGVYGTFRELLTDSIYIFAPKFEADKNKGIVTEIFNGSTIEYLCTVYFPFIPDIIRGGYAYRLKQEKDEFPVVEKYRIDPKVYGK